MPIDYSPRGGGKLYLPLQNKANKVISRMTVKWGVKCDIFYCQNDLSTLDIRSINTNELEYSGTPDVENIILCFPAFWENLGVNDFNFNSHESEEIGDSIYTTPAVVIPLLAKVVVRENGTNRVYIIRKTVLEHINNEVQLFLQYFVDIMPTDEAESQVQGLVDIYGDKSIFNVTDDTEYLNSGVTISKL
jgi:hypothetical protein